MALLAIELICQRGDIVVSSTIICRLKAGYWITLRGDKDAKFPAPIATLPIFTTPKTERISLSEVSRVDLAEGTVTTTRGYCVKIPWNHLGDKLVKMWALLKSKKAGKIFLENFDVTSVSAPFVGCRLVRQ